MRGGALLTATFVVPELPGCGASNPGDTTGGSSGGTTAGSGSSTTGSSGSSASGSTTGGTSSSGGTSTSGSSGTTGATCNPNTNTFSVAAAQIPVGGGKVFQDARFNDPQCGCGYNEFIVLQPTAGNFVALSTGCTHEFCAVSLNSSNSALTCPCHGSIFDLGGHVVRGPATSALTSLSVCSDGTNVYVQLA